MLLEIMYTEKEKKYLPLCSVSRYAVKRFYVQQIIMDYTRNEHIKFYFFLFIYIQGVPGECARLRENVPYTDITHNTCIRS